MIGGRGETTQGFQGLLLAAASLEVPDLPPADHDESFFLDRLADFFPLVGEQLKLLDALFPPVLRPSYRLDFGALDSRMDVDFRQRARGPLVEHLAIRVAPASITPSSFISTPSLAIVARTPV